MDRELRHLWEGLVSSLTDSSQGLFMHASWIFVAIMTLVMTAISIGRILPSRKARRTRRLAQEQASRVVGPARPGKHYANVRVVDRE